MRNYRDLQVWEKAHKLTLAIYRDTYDFPREERFGLTSQIRCSSASIAANLAEGWGRRSDGEMARFYTDFNGFGIGAFISPATRERFGFPEERRIFEAELRAGGSHENAIFAVAKD
jgi:23S rRNA-intervening sequence protein